MPRKLPALTGDNRAFWQGGENNELLIHRCSACTRYFHPPSPVCPTCNSFEVGPQAVSGKGQVASFTINHQPWTPELQEPFVIAIVELEEQTDLRFVSNIEGIPVTDVHIGMPVRVHFQQEDDVWLPLFVKD
ncbi:MAG TPA: Zn-ribbon domain-containing OB-fold protein [Pseudomonas xinjiangensis]|uniref:Zn-ribbon domain-containing OB-fold protein n=2 Tax=root TaxID=1 RepID=A0A7V1BQX8_9GAMM|nr:Zn-ribbon domain-containing OB-fold protein [Halopseudomonas xinjiangensis]HEC49042.1 Zn-ribbon domain-containing OB-fold protein [Halopseudomonas xinjiangensis]